MGLNRGCSITAAVGGMAGAALAPGVAQADTFVVENLLDDGSPESLRGALHKAWANGYERDHIVFASDLSGTIQLSDEPLYDDLDFGSPTDPGYPVAIHGPGADRITVRAADRHRVFEIHHCRCPGAWTISGLTLEGSSAHTFGGVIFSHYGSLHVQDSVLTGGAPVADGMTPGPHVAAGGAIFASETSVSVDSSTLRGNTAPYGGAIDVFAGDLSVTDSTISNNDAGRDGGGISINYGNLTVRSSTIESNDAGTDGAPDPSGDGGAIFAASTMALISNSTITGNTAEDGGALASTESSLFHPDAEGSGATRILNSTVAGNSVTETGGGLSLQDPEGATVLHNSIFAGNSAGTADPDLSGAANAAFTLIQSPGSATVTELVTGSNVTGADPLLGPLAENGGATRTMKPALGSPVVDAGNSFGSPVDQRGSERPVDLGDARTPNSTAAGADGADMGAVELTAPPPVPPVIPPAARYCRGEKVSIVAVPGTPTYGTTGRDVIAGTAGPDRIFAGAGDDLICGFQGDDDIGGGPGADTVLGGKGADRIRGQSGGDAFFAGPGRDVILGGRGRDLAVGGAGADRLGGGPHSDRLRGSNGPDSLRGGFGSDFLVGGPGNDLLSGGPGFDRLFGSLAGRDRDTFVGAAGDAISD